jgi:general secretion pathway protein G
MRNFIKKSRDAYGVVRTAYGLRTTHNAQRTTKHAFTLIELMIVVIIIAALSAMVVPRLSNRSEQAKITVAEADINSNIGLALKLYKLDNGRYPTTEQGLKALLAQPSSSPAPKNWNGPYLENEPLDPWKTEYVYKCPGANNAAGYDLYSLGADSVEGSADDVKNWK